MADNSMNIKYLIEEKIRLENEIRIREEAKSELLRVERTLQESMYNYLGYQNELSQV